jgi:hypothetical protein
MRDLKHLGLQVDCPAVMLTSQEPAGLVVQVTGKEIADPSISESEDNRVAVDGV